MKSSSDVRSEHPQYLNDESGLVSDGQADRIFFPETEEEVQQIVVQANKAEVPITISGGGTGISGGRVPLSGWIIATDSMTTLSDRGQEVQMWVDQMSKKELEYRLEVVDNEHAFLSVPVSMTVKMIQDLCRSIGWFYPPDPTERSCFIGGNVVTNASGARSFKYGPTRSWIHALRIVLPNGDLVILDRDEDPLGSNQITFRGSHGEYTVLRPTYVLPQTSKNVAGPVITDNSQSIDLFIGNDGLFGIITEVTLKLIRPPESILNIFIYVTSTIQALALAQHTQHNRSSNIPPVPMSVEYLDDRAVNIIRQQEEVPPEAQGIVILEQDAPNEDKLFEYIEFWTGVFDQLDLKHTSVAQSHNEIEHHKYLRHLIPETINEMARNNGQPKLGTDYAAPLNRMEDMLDLAKELGAEYERQIYPHGKGDRFGYAIWSHFGDNHIHLNFLPTTDDQKELAKDYMVRYMEQVISWNGSIAAEHGLGKKEFNGKPALELQLGSDGLSQVYKMKKILDPHMLLNRENLLGRDLSVYES